MCELADVAVGRGPFAFDRYSERFGCNMMDFYITDSLQDMLDIDIKSEMATDLGSSTDFSDTLGVSFSDLPPLLDIEMDNATTWIPGSNSTSHSSNFVQNLDLYGSEANAVMVNPNSVMPSIFSESSNKKSEESSHLIFVKKEPIRIPPSPAEEKVDSNHSSEAMQELKIKVEPDDFDDEDDENEETYEEEPIGNSKYIYIKREDIDIKEEPLERDEETITLPKNIISNLKFKTGHPEILKINGKNCSILNTNQNLTAAQYIKSQNGTQTFIHGNFHIVGQQQSRTILTNGNKTSSAILIENGTLNNNNNHINKQTLKPPTVPAINCNSENNSNIKHVPGNKSPYSAEFPKPAYSYSCLIAMALKNSRTGSLPVAEIYNFMCQHFPYFKTAPNGWKNSVRHNLSLNKCFEKIEKPSTNGGQRKGCLWAMNPSKVGKMDEEVQKWSRKDPQAIRKAMVRPDSLEALERGEMKFCSESNGEDYGSEEEELDVDEAYLVSSSPSGSPTYVQQYDDETSDVEVMEGVEIEDTKPLMLELSLASQYNTESPAKKPKTNIIYQAVSAASAHANRRKAPLVNRIG